MSSSLYLVFFVLFLVFFRLFIFLLILPHHCLHFPSSLSWYNSATLSPPSFITTNTLNTIYLFLHFLPGFRPLGQIEAGVDREAIQIGRTSVVAAILARRRRDRGLDLGEAAGRHRRDLQGTRQHPVQTPETSGLRGRARRQRRQVRREQSALWSGTNKNRNESAGPLARPFAHSLAPLTRSLACSLRSIPRSWVSEFLKSQNDLVLSHSAWEHRI